MASPATSLPAPISLRWHHDRFPRVARARWALRIVLALPFVALTDLATRSGIVSSTNERLHHQASILQWTTGVGWVSHAYPPLTLGIARLLPGGTGALGVAGAL